MKLIITILCLVLVFSNCSQQETSETVTEKNLAPSRYSTIEHLFNSISPDSFFVFSDWDIEKANFEFKGTSMDSNQVAILPHEWIENYTWNKDFGACYKFNIDSIHVALIARVPSEYVSSAIKLFVFNLQKDSITKTINLADIFGDAGEVSYYKSCIIAKTNNLFDIITYNGGSYDHRASDENDSIIENWNYYYLYKLNKDIIDTLMKDSASVVNHYPTLTNKLMKL